MQRQGYVYFLQSVIGGPIKIGWSDDVAKRLGDLQCGAPFALELLCVRPSTRQDEGALHVRFEAYRLHGEWFSPDCPELVAHIENLGGKVRETVRWEPTGPSDKRWQRVRHTQTIRTRKGPHLSEGARLLREGLAVRTWSQKELTARMTGRASKSLSNGQVDGWIHGDSKPGVSSALQLVKLLGIPLSAWSQPPRESATEEET